MAGGDQTQPVQGGPAQGAQTWPRNLDVETDWLHLSVWLQVQQGGTRHVHTARLETPPNTRHGAKTSGGFGPCPSLSSEEEKLDNSGRSW